MQFRCFPLSARGRGQRCRCNAINDPATRVRRTEAPDCRLSQHRRNNEAGQIVDAGHGEAPWDGWKGTFIHGGPPVPEAPAALPAGVTVRWLIPSPSWPSWPATGFTPRSWAARLFRRFRGWAIRRRVPALGFMPQAQGLASHIGHRSRPGETTWPHARSDSLPLAPPVSGCHAVNVQLNWQAAGANAREGAGPVCSSVHGPLTKPVPIPASRPALRTGHAQSLRDELNTEHTGQTCRLRGRLPRVLRQQPGIWAVGSVHA